MNSKTIVKLLIALLVLGGIAWYTQQEPGKDADPSANGIRNGDEVLADLELNDITRIEIAGPDGTNTVANKDGNWVVDSLHDFPADFDKVRDNIIEWSETKVGDVPRGGDDAEYGLSDTATTVIMKDQAGKTLATLLVGEARERKGAQFGGNDGRYIKVDDSPVLLVDSNFDALPSQSEDWITKDLLNIQSADITAVTIQGTNGTVTVDTKDSSAYVVNGLAEDEETTTANAGRAHRALQNLRFNSVANPSTDDTSLGLDKATVFTAKTKAGIDYLVHVGNESSDGNRYARIDATYIAPPAPTRAAAELLVPPDPEPEEATEKTDEGSTDSDAGADAESTDEEQAPEKTREEKVTEKLAELTKTHEKAVSDANEKVEALTDKKAWTYVLDSLDVEPLRFNRSELVSKKEEKDEEANATPQPVPPGLPLAPPPGNTLTPKPTTPPPVNDAAPKRTVTTPPIKVEPPKTVVSEPVKVTPPKKSVTTPPVKVEIPKSEPPSPPPVPEGTDSAKDAATETTDTANKTAADGSDKTDAGEAAGQKPQETP